MPNREINVPLSRRGASSEIKTSVVLIILLIICSFAVCNIVAPGAIRYFARQLSIPIKDETSLLPQDNGLPDTILGYKILAVKTAQNSVCISAGMGHVVLQSDGPDIQTFFAPPYDAQRVIGALNQINPQLQWSIDYVGPSMTFAKFAATNNAGNVAEVNGCVKMGGPIGPTITPAP